MLRFIVFQYIVNLIEYNEHYYVQHTTVNLCISNRHFNLDSRFNANGCLKCTIKEYTVGNNKANTKYTNNSNLNI